MDNHRERSWAESLFFLASLPGDVPLPAHSRNPEGLAFLEWQNGVAVLTVTFLGNGVYSYQELSDRVLSGNSMVSAESIRKFGRKIKQFYQKEAGQ